MHHREARQAAPRQARHQRHGLAAQYWLDSEREVPRDEAVALMASLAWRGLAGFPMVHERPPGS